MAAEVLKDFLARLGFEVDEAGAEQFNSALATSATRVAAFGAAIQAMAVGAYAAIYKIAEAKSQLLSVADAVGEPVSRLQELQFVAEQTGASADALSSSLEGLTERLGQASIGQGGLETFHRLGISIRDSSGRLRDSADVLLDVGEKLKGMDTARATMFMGQLGIDRKLLRMLTSDVGGLRQAYQEMYQAVGVDADKAAEDSRKFVGEVGALKAMLQLVADGIAAIFVGQMGEDVVSLRKMIQENVGKIIPVLKTVIDVVLRIGKVFGALTARLVSWVSGIIDWFGMLEKATQNLILVVLGFAAAWKWLNLSFLLTPLGAIISGFIALLALVDDFTVWSEGGSSLIDWGPWADDIDAVVSALGVLFSALGEVWDVVKGPLMATLRDWGGLALSVIGGVVSAVAKLVVAVVKLFQGDFAGAMDAVITAFEALLQAVDKVAGYVLQVFGGLGQAVNDSLGWMVDGLKGLLGFDSEAQGRGAPVLAPAPAQAAAATAGAGGMNLESHTTVQVYGAGDPAAVGRRVAGEQDRANADLVRHARGAAK